MISLSKSGLAVVTAGDDFDEEPGPLARKAGGFDWPHILKPNATITINANRLTRIVAMLLLFRPIAQKILVMLFCPDQLI